MSKSKKIRPGLGKGLGALLPDVGLAKEQKEKEPNKENQNFENLTIMVEVDKVRENPYQPRQEFDEEALNALADSIKTHGLITPITIRRSINGFELISGERRLRASKKAGLKEIPAYLRDIKGSSELLELAIIENVQREDLNPIEVSHGYQRLIEECGYTQEQVAERVGKDRSTVTNFLRLLRLPERIQEMLRSNQISMGHARALLSLDDHAQMIVAGKEIQEKSLSVRATEKLVKEISSKKKPKTKTSKKEIVSSETKAVLEKKADHLRHNFGTNVRISPKTKESGTIEFDFYSADDLERLIELFDIVIEEMNKE